MHYNNDHCKDSNQRFKKIWYNSDITNDVTIRQEHRTKRKIVREAAKRTAVIPTVLHTVCLGKGVVRLKTQIQAQLKFAKTTGNNEF